MIIVDDGSRKENCISKFVKPSNKIKTYRVCSDLGFNSHGCRNLIVNQSSNDWIALIDIDRRFHDPEYTFKSLSQKKLKHNVRYVFMTHKKDIGLYVHRSVNDFLINRNHFLSVGGYDEEIVGQRWGDREFFDQLRTFGGSEMVLNDIDLIITKGPSMILEKGRVTWKTTTYKDLDLIYSRVENPDVNKPTLQFEWYQIS